MDVLRFDRLAKNVSRRGLGAVLGGGLLAGHTLGAAKKRKSAKRRKSCGGRPTELTRFCGTGGECETDENCAAGCACVERQISCCRKVRRKNGKRPRSRRCIDGRPGLYCAPDE